MYIIYYIHTLTYKAMRYRLTVKINPQARAIRSVAVLPGPITHFHNNVPYTLNDTDN